MHAYLHQFNDAATNPSETVIYGPSTSNQIERWWRELHERMEKYFKEHLSKLKAENNYNSHGETDRSLLAFLFIPVIQKQLDIFKDTVWNSHRIQKQKETDLPDGVPNHIYQFPEKYGLDECGFPITEEQLKDVAETSGVLKVSQDLISPEFKAQRLSIIFILIKLSQMSAMMHSFILKLPSCKCTTQQKYKSKIIS